AAPPLPIAFHARGTVNRPCADDGRWFVSQYRRWGMLDGAPDADANVATIAHTAMYDAAVAEMGATYAG
ncbi:nitrate ABC transporter substrate-binding protein, partial [Paraburkholderia sp. Se-20369]|nr:nitrate ABC transporter substrate-binding protein [Paraburkholderia sp. Se-20369]